MFWVEIGFSASAQQVFLYVFEFGEYAVEKDKRAAPHVAALTISISRNDSRIHCRTTYTKKYINTLYETMYLCAGYFFIRVQNATIVG